jgi:hypothetical protein
MSDKTKWIFEEEPNKNASPFTETVKPTEFNYAAGASPYDATRLIDQKADEKTQLHLASSLDVEEESDPVVGWLVVIKGPGLGQSINIGGGMNTVGRGVECRVSLPFGDTLISGDDHLRIIYDDSHRSFLLAPGTGKNITRANGQVVSSTMPITNRSIIELSKKTTVRFMSFCDDTFDWSDISASET